MAEMAATETGTAGEEGTRRDFLYLLTGATAAVGAAALCWPLIDSMNPTADVLALGSIAVDVWGMVVVLAIRALWRGPLVFPRLRPAAEPAAARTVDLAALPDPEPDEDRVVEPQWLVMVGICTHLGCIPLGQKASDPHGDFGGWFCPCHGSHYDTSGRIRQGPAPRNLVVPEYEFTGESVIRIG